MELYECLKCNKQNILELFTDTEYDGDVWGKCPNCKEFSMLFEVNEYYQKSGGIKHMSNFEGRELSWEDQIVNDSPDFILLPEGDYDFEVVNFERARHNGSDKLPPCNKAIIHIKIETPQGIATIKHNLFLHSITEGMLCSFFTGIGQRQKGEKITMNWNKVIGSKGKAKVGVREWKNDEGRDVKVNEIKKFYEPTQKPDFSAGRF